MAMEFHDVKTFEGQRFDNNKVSVALLHTPATPITQICPVFPGMEPCFRTLVFHGWKDICTPLCVALPLVDPF